VKKPSKKCISCACPECGAPFKRVTGDAGMRTHRYKVHGIHWDRKRKPRGVRTPYKAWSDADLSYLRRHKTMSDVEIGKVLKRSYLAVGIKRKRLQEAADEKKMRRRAKM
jgi:hypothetical protein